MDKEQKASKIEVINKGESYILGLLSGLVVGIVIAGIVAIIISMPWYVFMGVTIAIALVVIGDGLRLIPERYNAIPTFLGSPVKNVLGDGLVWWFPRWLGGGIMEQVSIAKQTMEVVIGDTGGAGEIYSKDGVPLSITVTIIYKISNVYRWVVEYEGNPAELIVDYVERIVRWFADELEAEDLVKLNAIMAKVLEGIKEDSREIKFKRTVQKDNGHGIPKVETIVETIELPEAFTKESLSDSLEKVGATLEKVLVRRIAVPQELSSEWIERAKERAQREAELADTSTTVAVIKKLIQDTGMSREEARNMVETLRGRGQRQIVTIEGDALGALATLLGGVANKES